MDNFRVIEVKQSIFADNDKDAERLRSQLKEEKTFLVNLMSSPGSGKTTTLTQLIPRLKDELNIGVMEAMRILQIAEDNGYVHQVTNIDGENKIFGICNCNVQICNALRTSQLFNTPNLGRADWVDGLRAACVLFVFFVHDGLPGGPMLSILGLACAVPAFFFAAGLFADRTFRQPLAAFALRRAQQLLIPYAVFGVLTLFVCALLHPELWPTLPTELGRLALGRRNHLFAAALWFLPCLWVQGILYRAAFCQVRNRWLRLALAAAVSLAARLFWQEPIAVFSLNQSLRYLVYYALGDALAPLLLARDPSPQLRSGLLGAGILGLVCCTALYFADASVLRGPVPESEFSAALTSFAVAVTGFAAFRLLGTLAGRLPLVALVGRNSLLYCCTEALAHPLFTQLLALFGVGFAPGSAVGRFAADSILIVFITLVFVVPVTLFVPALGGKTKKAG